MAKYLIVYKQTSGHDEAIEVDETLEEAIEIATHDSNHWDYGRRGVRIYEMPAPVYEKLERE